MFTGLPYLRKYGKYTYYLSKFSSHLTEVHVIHFQDLIPGWVFRMSKQSNTNAEPSQAVAYYPQGSRMTHHNLKEASIVLLGWTLSMKSGPQWSWQHVLPVRPDLGVQSHFQPLGSTSSVYLLTLGWSPPGQRGCRSCTLTS